MREFVRTCSLKAQFSGGRTELELDGGYGLRHVDDSTELDFPVAGRRRSFSEQLGCNPQRFYFSFDSQDFLLFHSEYFKGILHREGSLKNNQHSRLNQAPTLSHGLRVRKIKKVHA
jgi:hypothetical protein